MSMKRILVGTAWSLGLAGLVLVGFPLFSSLAPSERAKAGAPFLEIDVSNIPEGEARQFEWNSLPVVVLHRTKEQLKELTEVDKYRDHEGLVTAVPDPEGLSHQYRSIKPEYFVAYAWTGNAIQCHSVYAPELYSYPSISGGFSEMCRGSSHDVTGRLLRGSWKEGGDLPIPPYHFIDKKTIKVGPPNDHVLRAWRKTNEESQRKDKTS